jgi:hypothetical protein
MKVSAAGLAAAAIVGVVSIALIAGPASANDGRGTVAPRFVVRTGGPSSEEAGARPPGRLPSSALYTGRGKGIQHVSIRLRGHELIEAKVVFVEHCTTTGDGRRRHYRLRQESDQASRALPAKVDQRGGFRVERSEVNFASDELERFVGTLTGRSVVGELALVSHASAPESGVFDTCQTGPYPPAPMRPLTFHARRR